MAKAPTEYAFTMNIYSNQYNSLNDIGAVT